MSFVPDEVWRGILEMGIKRSKWEYKELCCLSITCTRLNRLSSEDPLWSHLLFSDFPSSSTNHNHPSSKSLYKIRFERDKERKVLAHRRSVLRGESRIAEHSRKLQEIQQGLAKEVEKLQSTLVELSNLHKVRQASIALNVWQPEVIRGRQKQIIEQCVVPVDYRVNALEMEVKLCKKQIDGFHKAYRDEMTRLDAAKEQLASVKYHPLRDYNSTSSNADKRGISRKKLKKCVGSESLISFSA